MTTRNSVLLALAVLLLAFRPVPLHCQVTTQRDGKGESALVREYQTALQSHNWLDAKSILKQLIALKPDRWAYQQALGDAELNLGQYQEALQSYEAGILMATSGTDRRSGADSAGARAAVGQMLTSEGNIYLKMQRSPEAIAAFTKAAAVDPHAGRAYFNLCATAYNAGTLEAALAVCDKAIEADPTRADAYFIKGSILFGMGDLDAQRKYLPRPGTVEALKRYLELAPDGPHASDVRQMLDFVGAKAQTTDTPKN